MVTDSDSGYSSLDPLDPAEQPDVKPESFLGHHTDDRVHRRSNPRRLGADLDLCADHGDRASRWYPSHSSS